MDSQLLEEESGAESGMLVLSVFTMIFALALMLLEMTTSDRVVRHPEADRDNKITVPENGDPDWDDAIGDSNSHKYNDDKTAGDEFKRNVLPKIPERPADPSPENVGPQPTP